jgi:heme/copper-type cytochrome/quinol oxidase subunit 3
MTNIPITPEEQEILESGIETTDELSIASHMKQSGRHLSREESHKDRTILFGFWVYLMTDFVLFSALFAVFVVLRIGMSGGVKSLAVDAPFVLTETLILLTSSFVTSCCSSKE